MPHAGTPHSFWRRRKFWVVSAAGTVALLGLLAWTGFYLGWLGENLREVDPGTCYRSGQMTPRSLREHIDRLKIGCVVNLRGFCKDDWYDAEVQVCKDSKIEHADFKIDPE